MIDPSLLLFSTKARKSRNGAKNTTTTNNNTATTTNLKDASGHRIERNGYTWKWYRVLCTYRQMALLINAVSIFARSSVQNDASVTMRQKRWRAFHFHLETDGRVNNGDPPRSTNKQTKVWWQHEARQSSTTVTPHRVKYLFLFFTINDTFFITNPQTQNKISCYDEPPIVTNSSATQRAKYPGPFGWARARICHQLIIL